MAVTAKTAESWPGVTSWVNPRNGFTVFRLHYTADPRKNDPTWKDLARRGIPERDWRREYEIDWTSPEGEPVIPEYDAQVHERALTPNPALRLLRFWDPGFVSPAVVFAQLTTHGQLRVVGELAPFNTPLTQLCPMVWAMTDELVGHRNVFDAGDPASEANDAHGSITAELARFGVFLRTNRPGTEESYRTLRSRFMQRIFVPGVGHEPAVTVDPGRCPILVEALRGAFHLSPHPPYRPVAEHPYKDIVDALRYGSDNLAYVNKEFQSQLRQMARNDWQWQ